MIMQILLITKLHCALCSNLLSCTMLFFFPELTTVWFFHLPCFSRGNFQMLQHCWRKSISNLLYKLKEINLISPLEASFPEDSDSSLYWLFPNLIDQLSFLDFLSDPLFPLDLVSFSLLVSSLFCWVHL